MAGIKVEIQGLEALKERFSAGTLNKALVPALSLAAKQLHTEIAKAVVDTYMVSTDEVNASLEGKSASNLKFGTNFVEQSLNYRFKAKRLSTFPFKVQKIPSAPNRYMVVDPTRISGFSLRWKNYAIKTEVRVKRKGGYKTVIGKKGYGGFHQGISSTNKRSNIFERKQEATWDMEPEERAPFVPLFGPSISQMVNQVLQRDTRVQQQLNNLAEFINNNIKL